MLDVKLTARNAVYERIHTEEQHSVDVVKNVKIAITTVFFRFAIEGLCSLKVFILEPVSVSEVVLLMIPGFVLHQN